MLPPSWLGIALLAGAPGLGFDEALVLAARHPAALAASRALDARRAHDADISGLAGQPSLQILPGWRLPGAESPGFEGQLSLSMPLDTGGIGSARQAAAKEERAALSAGLRAEVLTRSLDVARAWLRLWGAEQALELANGERALAEDLAERISRAVRLGAAVETEALEARLEADQATREAIDAEGQLHDAALGLEQALGGNGDGLPSTTGAPPEVPLPGREAWPAWLERARQLPDALAARRAALAAERRVAGTRAQGSTWISPTVQAQWEQPGEALLFVGATVTPSIFSTQARAESQARAEAQLEAGRAEAKEAAAGVALHADFHELEHTRELEAHARGAMLPTARAWLSATERLLSAGEIEVRSVLLARRRLARIQREILALETERRWAELRVWLQLSALEESS